MSHHEPRLKTQSPFKMHTNRHETLLQHMARKLFYTQLPTRNTRFVAFILATKTKF